MAPKIKHTLIPLIVLLFLLGTSQSPSAGKTSNSTFFLPLINYNPSGWIGPSGGTIVAIAIDPTDPEIVYAGSYGSGVYKSRDGGRTWFSTSLGLTNLHIYSLAIDPTHPEVIYAGTYKSQVFKSTDGGYSWSWSGVGMQDGAIVYSLAIDPVVPSTIYAATRGISNNGSAPWNGVLYKSNDGGLTWQVSRENMGGMELQDWVYSVTVNPHAHNEVLIAAHESGPFRSTDYGTTWQSIHDGIGDDSGRVIAIAPQPEYPVTCYYGVWHNDSVYKSTNSCTLWSTANLGIDHQHVYSIGIDPFNANNLFLATFRNGILKSTNGGTSWQYAGLADDDIYSVALDPQTPSNVLAGTSGDGLYRSTDSGINWQQSSNGIQNAMVTSVVQDPNDSQTIFASIYGAGVYQYNYRQASWINISNGLTDKNVWDLLIDPTNPRLLYATTNEGGLFKNNLDSGTGWVLVGSALPQTQNIQSEPLPTDHPFATLEMQEASADQPTISTNGTVAYAPLMTMVFAPSNPEIAYLGTDGSGVWVSSDGGASWKPSALNSGTILSLAIDLANPNNAYAATTKGGSIAVTINGGQSWDTISLEQIFYTLAASPVEPGVLYAGTTNGVYRYQANTKKWTSLGPANTSITAINIDPAAPNRIFAGTTTGAQVSLDGGLAWSNANNNLDGQTIDIISINPLNPSLVYFGTTTHGIYLLVYDK
jgi:photosystem II stability/assembly factor-like uncharacterized protein